MVPKRIAKKKTNESLIRELLNSLQENDGVKMCLTKQNNQQC